jgi:hypothetical protein
VYGSRAKIIRRVQDEWRALGKRLKRARGKGKIQLYKGIYMEIRILFDEGKKGRLRLDAMSLVVRRVPSVLLVFSRSRQARAVRARLSEMALGAGRLCVQS